MPLPQLHTIKLKEVAEPKDGACKFEINCSCQWQGLAHTIDRADAFIDAHVYAQCGRGHRVIIERDMISKPIVLVDAQE